MQEVFVPIDRRVNRELDPATLAQPIDFRALFGNSNPVELEIGIGKGLFLVHAAQHQPDHNFLGAEISRKYLRMARERIEKRHIENVRVLSIEAHGFLEDFVAPESLRIIHIYFPDPWPKKRHHKRRLINTEFLKLAHRVLEPGGELLIATDHSDYWSWISQVLADQTLLQPCDRLPMAVPGTSGLTNYEIKYLKEGREIYRAGYQKPG